MKDIKRDIKVIKRELFASQDPIEKFTEQAHEAGYLLVGRGKIPKTDTESRPSIAIWRNTFRGEKPFLVRLSTYKPAESGPGESQIETREYSRGVLKELIAERKFALDRPLLKVLGDSNRNYGDSLG